MTRAVADHPQRPSGGSPPAPRRAERRIELHRPVLALWSIILAASLVVSAIGHLPRHLAAETDIVGYPTFANFDINRYFQTFDLVVLGLPVLSLLIYLGARQVCRLARVEVPALRLHRPPAPEIHVDEATEKRRSHSGRALFVGAVLGLELAMATARPVLGSAIVVAALYFVVIGGLAVLAGRVLHHPDDVLLRRAALNAAFVPLTVVALLAVSDATAIKVVATGAVHHFGWLPTWFAVALALGVAAWVFIALGRARSGDDVLRLDRRVTLYVAGPVAIALLWTRIASALGRFDVFHEGETLGAANLTFHGKFPWRDFAYIHGPLYDIFRGGLGLKLVQDSRWGAWTGESLAWVPLFWVGLYFFAARVFRRNWLALVASACLAVCGPAFLLVHLRFLLWPIVLVAMAWVLERPRWWTALVFMATFTLQVALSPETVYGVVACMPVIVLFDLARFQRGRGLLANFPRTLWSIGAGAVTSVVWLGYLAANGALGHYIGDLLAFRADHSFTGGIPVAWSNGYFQVAVYLPVAGILIAVWYFVARARQWRSLDADDAMLASATIMTFLYYGKFLARADGHVFQSWAAGIPMLLILAAKAIDFLEHGWNRTWLGYRSGRFVGRHAVALVLVPVAAIVPSVSLVHRLPNLASDIRGLSPTEPWNARLGFTTEDALQPSTLDDLRAFLDTYVGPKGKLFDFTNEPGLFHYVLPYTPATRYYHVSMAIARQSQLQLVDELKKARPEIVVYDEPLYGLPNWDQISNTVRHYEVANYLLSAYKPFAMLRGFIFLIRNDVDVSSLPPPPATLSEPPQYDDIMFHAHPCDWGYSLTFLSVPGVGKAGGIDVPLDETPAEDQVQFSLPDNASTAEFPWMEIDVAGPAKDATVTLRDAAFSDDEYHRVTLRTRPGGPTRIRVPVGACPVWHAQGSGHLVLAASNGARVTRVRLLR